jgi:hypothetical protein
VIEHRPYLDYEDQGLVCVWPLHTPPTPEDLERINFMHEMVGRRLTCDEVLNLMVPRGRA